MSIKIEQWHSKIESTLKWRNDYWNGTKAWQRFLALYRGDHWRTSSRYSTMFSPDSDFPRDRITVNKTLSTVLTVKPFLIKKRPRFIIRPRRYDNPEDIVSAFLQQELLNYEWRERKMQRHARNAVNDAIIFGHGILKNGFTYSSRVAQNPNKDGDIEYREYIRAEAPYLERINPLNFLFDVETDNCDLESSRWCAQIFFRSKEDVIADNDYDKKARRNIASGFEDAASISPILYKNQEDTENKLLILYEVWDKKYRKYYILCKGISIPLVEDNWPYDYLEGYPFDKLDYINIPNEPYGIGVPFQIEDQQLEKNRVRTTMFEHRRRFNRKYIAVESEIEPSELNKFEQGEDGTIVWAKTQNAIFPIQDANLTSDNYRLDQIIDGDFNEITGIDALIRNASLPSRTSAAEISARQNYSNLKLDDRVEDVDNFILESGRKMLQHIKANYSGERVIEVVGSLGNFWVKYSPHDIQAEVEIDMDTVSASRIDPLIERQQAIELMQVLSPNIQTLMQVGAMSPQELQQVFKTLVRKIIGENRELSGFGLSGLVGQQAGSVTNPQQLAAGMFGGLGGGIPTQGNIPS